MIGIIAQAAPEGVISGGWGYVIAAYVITWLCFIGYALSLQTRLGSSRRELAEQAETHREGS